MKTAREIVLALHDAATMAEELSMKEDNDKDDAPIRWAERGVVESECQRALADLWDYMTSRR